MVARFDTLPKLGEDPDGRVVYVHEIADARRRHMRRSRMTAEYAGALRVVLQDADCS